MPLLIVYGHMQQGLGDNMDVRKQKPTNLFKKYLYISKFQVSLLNPRPIKSISTSSLKLIFLSLNTCIQISMNSITIHSISKLWFEWSHCLYSFTLSSHSNCVNSKINKQYFTEWLLGAKCCTRRFYTHYIVEFFIIPIFRDEGT